MVSIHTATRFRAGHPARAASHALVCVQYLYQAQHLAKDAENVEEISKLLTALTTATAKAKEAEERMWKGVSCHHNRKRRLSHALCVCPLTVPQAHVLAIKSMLLRRLLAS
jgi:hypothetical protein